MKFKQNEGVWYLKKRDLIIRVTQRESYARLLRGEKGWQVTTEEEFNAQQNQRNGNLQRLLKDDPFWKTQ
ncbi:MAG TPA: hypothetical protein VJB96_01865 [Patescibacteria group bacterium]|nr:hypothetical protein [Patescibacteria group bacterium]